MSAATTTRCAACDWYAADPASARGWCRGCEAFATQCPNCPDALIYKMTEDEWEHVYTDDGNPILMCRSCGHEEPGS